MKVAGEFEFLGDAYRGDPDFDKPPPEGVVKLYYLGRDVRRDITDGGAPERCGLYRCPWWRWGAFKEAVTRRWPRMDWGVQAARGVYPVAHIVVIPDAKDEDS